MSSSLKSSDLLISIKRRMMLPDSQVTFSDTDLLEMATEEMNIQIVPHVLQVHQDYYLTDSVQDLTSNNSNYPIPYRAIGSKTRDIFYKDTNDNLYEMTRIPLENITEYQGSLVSTQYRTYFLKNNEIEIFPHLSSNPVGSLAFYYYISPNKLVTEDRAAIIESIDLNNGIISVDAVPSHFQAGMKIDFIMDISPNRIITYDITVQTVNSTNKTISFDVDDIPSTLVVGDHILLAKETIVPQIPVELHPVLAQLVAVACLESLGDINGLKIAQDKLMKMSVAAGILIDNRVEGSPVKVVNQHGLLRKAVFGRQYTLRRN